MNNGVTFTIQLDLEDILHQNSSRPFRGRVKKYASSKVIHLTALKSVTSLHLLIAYTLIH